MTARSTTSYSRRRGLPTGQRCSACRQEPSTPAQHLDLTTEWLFPGAQAGELVARRFCRGCAPSGPLAEVVCTRCGDGPLLAGELPVIDPQVTAAVDGWLEQAGWRLAGPVCPGCMGELSR